MNNKNRNGEIWSKEVQAKLNVASVVWLFVTVGGGLILANGDCNFEECRTCIALQEIIPAIDRVNSNLRYENELKLSWVYVISLSPFLVAYLLLTVKRLNNEVLSTANKGALIVIAIGCSSVCLYGPRVSELSDPFIFGDLYQTSLFGALIITAVCWFSFILFAFIAVKSISLKLQKFTRKFNDWRCSVNK